MLKVKKIKPLFTGVLVTGHKYEQDTITSTGVILGNQKKGDLKLFQTVIAVGSTVRDIQPGDKIVFDPTRYAVMKYDPNSVKNDMDMNKVIKWNLPWVQMVNDKGEEEDYLLLQDRDILYVYEGEEVAETIVLPPKPSLLIH